ncbi:HNH endonuclease [Cronobacter turicensis]
MDLSVADLLKNKILSNVSDNYQDAALAEWDEVVKKIQSVPASFVDYIKIYWNAYESVDITKANLYQTIRKNIGNHEKNTRDFLANLTDNAESFDKLKNKSNLNWPKINLQEKWAENVAEMNLLGYTIHLPCFLYAHKNNEQILERLAELSLNLLFRWVTICDYGISEIDSLFKKVLADLKLKKSNKEIFSHFHPLIEKVQSSFAENFQSFETESSTILKYISCKIELFNGSTNALIPNFLDVDLEHILPRSYTKWEQSGNMFSFSKPYSRWVNSVGNVILLEKGKNRKIKDAGFSEKKEVYSTSSFLEAKKIYQYEQWDEASIIQRAEYLANLAENIWPLALSKEEV